MAQKRKQTGADGAEAGQEGAAAGKAGAYQVVARRFRPQTFSELVGQDDVLKSLRTALEQGRVPHAFLFSGSRGVGKTTSARILARCLNCEKGPTPEPCGVCDACTSILDGSNPDIIEVDAASNNSVDDIRQLRESVGFATMRSRYRVVILDEVHMLSKAAFNAFLKTLEEPPPKVVFVMATTERHKVPDTILSRCQVLLFKRVGEDDLVRRLRMIADKEGAAVPDDVLMEIAASVRGGVRDAETALERVLPLARELGEGFDLAAYRTLTARVGADAVLEVIGALLQGDARKGLHFAKDLQQHGTDEREALGEIVDMLRWLLLLKIDGDDTGLVPLAGKLREQLQALAQDVDAARLDAMIGAGLLGRDRLRRLEDRGAVFEVALVRMAQAGALPTLADLLAEARAGGLRAPMGGGGGGGGVGATQSSAPTRRFGKAAREAEAQAQAAAQAQPARPVAPVQNANELKARTLQRLNDRKLLQTTVELCRVDGPDDNGKVIVTLESERKMHRDRLKSPEIHSEVVKAFAAAAGREVKVEIRIPDDVGAGGGGAGAAGNAAPPPKTKPPGEKAKRVIEAFGGRVVQVDPKDRIRKPEPKPAADAVELDPGLVEEPPESDD